MNTPRLTYIKNLKNKYSTVLNSLEYFHNTKERLRTAQKCYSSHLCCNRKLCSTENLLVLCKCLCMSLFYISYLNNVMLK